jgi:hypothetical protein
VLAKSEIERFLSREVESATQRHLAAEQDLELLTTGACRERRVIDENDPEMRAKERMLRNARLALLLALQRYNSFVSRGIVPEKLWGLTDLPLNGNVCLPLAG